MAVTLLVAMALPFLLPPKYSLGLTWIIPVAEALLLVALIVADPGRIDRRSVFIRALSIALVGIVVTGAAGATVRLVIDLLRGGPETNSPDQLLRVGSLAWAYVIIAFSFLYWELDGGGPEVRTRATPKFPDLAFPEHLNPQIARPGWRPEFFDYLYLAFTNAARVQSNRRDAAGSLGQTGDGGRGGGFSHHCGTCNCPSSQHPQVASRTQLCRDGDMPESSACST